jgi:hypothetical protein
MERGIEQYLMIAIVMVVALADLLRSWLKRRAGQGGPVELEAPQELARAPEPQVLRRPDVPAPIPHATSMAARERSSAQAVQRAGRLTTARTPVRATTRATTLSVAPLIGSRSDLRRAIVLREVLGPPKGLDS